MSDDFLNPEPPPNPATDTLFRRRALEQAFRDEERREPLRVSPPWTWSLFWVMGALFSVALAGSIVGKVEDRDRGRGILRPQEGVRLLQAQIGGVVAQTYAHSGDPVREGQPIARIEVAQVQSSIVETDRQLKLLKQEGQGFAAREQGLLQEQIRSVQGKIANQQTQVTSFVTSVEFQEQKVEAHRKLLKEGLVSPLAVGEIQDQLGSTRRQLDAARQQLSQLRQELASLEGQRQHLLWEQTQQLQGAEIRREALDSSLRQTELKAPVEGFLEALVAKPGDLLQPGQTVAKLIPAGSPMIVVAFLPEKDRAFVKTGDIAALELDAYPYSEYGTLKAQVLRVGSDLASPHEVREALGEEARLEAPAYRVELRLMDERPQRLRAVQLRPGVLLQARFTLRRRRLVTLVLDPLRRWLD